mmetsp:Transcript_58356/g.85528  ORF Transcript_58356/g.85528 Transcript_58356/m.85528 type:complete len:201 (-) Transcript_58356:668-1270(-)
MSGFIARASPRTRAFSPYIALSVLAMCARHSVTSSCWRTSERARKGTNSWMTEKDFCILNLLKPLRHRVRTITSARICMSSSVTRARAMATGVAKCATCILQSSELLAMSTSMHAATASRISLEARCAPAASTISWTAPLSMQRRSAVCSDEAAIRCIASSAASESFRFSDGAMLTTRSLVGEDATNGRSEAWRLAVLSA